MTLFNAINSALSGLKAEAQKLSSISNNVANSSTVGYKRADTLFETMVLDGTAFGGSNLSGVTAKTRMEISTVGQVETTGINTDLAVNGSGFFVVNNNADSSAGKYLVTRAGSFRPDAEGNLVNSGGYFLQGIQLNSAGQPINNTTDSNITSLQTVNVGNLQATASPTTAVTFNSNLPSTDITEWTIAAGSPAVHASSVQYYDALGNAQTLTFTFTPHRTDPAGGLGAGLTANTWDLVVQDTATTTAIPGTYTYPPLSATDGGVVASATILFNGTGAGTNAGTMDAVYNWGTTAANGAYDTTTGKMSLTLGGGSSIQLDIGMTDSGAAISQFAGNYSATKIQKDGASFGLLQGVSVDTSGKVIASFSNGSTRPIYQLQLAIFANPDGLNPVSGGAYAMDPAAGVPRLYKPGDGPAGSTEGGALEGSNVDISTELTNLIETQRAYSSSATVIQTSNQMLDVANRLNQ